MFQTGISKYLVGTTTECIMDRSLPVCFITPSGASLHIHLQSSFKSVSFLTFFCQVFMSKKNCEKRWDSFCCVCSFLFSSIVFGSLFFRSLIWSLPALQYFSEGHENSCPAGISGTPGKLRSPDSPAPASAS